MIKNLLKNKRGDIPITILVVGILAICIMALFSFYFSDKIMKKGFNDISLVDEISLLKEKILVYRELGFSDEKIYEILDVKKDDTGNYLFLNRNSLLVKYYID